MKASLSKIVKEAMEASVDTYKATVEEATQLLRSESGTIGNLEVYGRLVKMEPSGEALILGDLHGDLESLTDIMRESNILQRMNKSKSAHLIFLGDYGDRGDFSPEVIGTVVKVKLLFPTQVVLMRGNHEGPKDILAYPHDLPAQLQTRFGRDWVDVYSRVFEMFQHLYTSVLVKGRFLMVHGGPSEQVFSIEDLAYAHENHPRTPVLEDILWSDPSNSIQGVYPSPRGAGKLFGKDVTEKALDTFKVKILLRGHESCDRGFKIDHDDKILTLFSRKGPPYFNAHGAYLDLKLFREYHEAGQLVPYVHEF